MDDSELLEQYVQNGSRQAIDELVRRHIGMVYATACRELGDANLAEDVVQAVFLILMRRSGKISRRVVLGGWLFNVTRFAAADVRKSQARRCRHEREAALLNQAIHGVNAASDREELMPLLNDAVASLSGRDRDAVVMAYLEGMSHRDMAESQHITENAVRQRLFRALAKMRKYVARKKLAVSEEVLSAALASAGQSAIPAKLTSRIIPILHAPSAAVQSAAIAESTLKTIRMWTSLKTAGVIGAILAVVFIGGTAAAMYLAGALAKPDERPLTLPLAQSARVFTSTATSVEPAPFRSPPPARWLFQQRPQYAPFQAIVMQDNKPEILLDGTWYELVAINTILVNQLIKAAGGPAKLRYIGTDTERMLQNLHHPAGKTVTLSVKDLSTGDTKLLNDVPMTTENRSNIISYERNHGNTIALDLDHSLPYRAIRWIDETPQVLIEKKWYELQAINDIRVSDIIGIVKNAGPAENGDSAFYRSTLFQKLFGPRMLAKMGRPVGPTVDLTVRDLDTGEVRTLKDVPMTEANMTASNDYDRLQQAIKLGDESGGFEKRSPFQSVDWVEDGLRVQVNGNWYQLHAINDVSLVAILAYEQSVIQIHRKSEQMEAVHQHFEDDLVEILTRMNHPPGERVKLSLRILSTNQDVTLDNVAMTSENRAALIRQTASSQSH